MIEHLGFGTGYYKWSSHAYRNQSTQTYIFSMLHIVTPQGDLSDKTERNDLKNEVIHV